MGIEDRVKRVGNIHRKLADAIGNPNTVRCGTCGREEAVDAAHCLRQGWPKCCGYTMTLLTRGSDGDSG